MKIDSLQQSEKGPSAADFVSGIIGSGIVRTFVLGTNCEAG